MQQMVRGGIESWAAEVRKYPLCMGCRLYQLSYRMPLVPGDFQREQVR